MQELIVKDEEFSSYKDTLCGIENSIEAEMSTLVKILSSVCDDVVVDGNFHENLVNFVARLSEMKGELSNISRVSDDVASEFVEDIDEIDKSIY